jgi:hypothetical protein
VINLVGFKKFETDKALVKKLAFLEVEWRRACPDVDLQEQLGWAHYWISTNAKGAKYKDMIRFLSNWFKGCQRDQRFINDRRKEQRRANPLPQVKESPPPESEVVNAEDWKHLRETLRNTAPREA